MPLVNVLEDEKYNHSNVALHPLSSSILPITITAFTMKFTLPITALALVVGALAIPSKLQERQFGFPTTTATSRMTSLSNPLHPDIPTFFSAQYW